MYASKYILNILVYIYVSVCIFLHVYRYLLTAAHLNVVFYGNFILLLIYMFIILQVGELKAPPKSDKLSVRY